MLAKICDTSHNVRIILKGAHLRTTIWATTSFVRNLEIIKLIKAVDNCKCTVKQAVIAGLGIAFISAHTAATELEGGRLVTLDVAAVVCRAEKSQAAASTGATMLDFLVTNGERLLPRAPNRTD
jgi:hypothetical protein